MSPLGSPSPLPPLEMVNIRPFQDVTRTDLNNHPVSLDIKTGYMRTHSGRVFYIKNILHNLVARLLKKPTPLQKRTEETLAYFRRGLIEHYEGIGSKTFDSSFGADKGKWGKIQLTNAKIYQLFTSLNTNIEQYNCTRIKDAYFSGTGQEFSLLLVDAMIRNMAPLSASFGTRINIKQDIAIASKNQDSRIQVFQTFSDSVAKTDNAMLNQRDIDLAVQDSIRKSSPLSNVKDLYAYYPGSDQFASIFPSVLNGMRRDTANHLNRSLQSTAGSKTIFNAMRSISRHESSNFARYLDQDTMIKIIQRSARKVEAQASAAA